MNLADIIEAFEECFDAYWIELATCMLVQIILCILGRPRALVVARRYQCIIDVSHGNNTRYQWYVFADKPIRIAASIEPLMMV